MERLKELGAHHASLLLERQSWDSDARKLAHHFLPRKYRLLETTDKTNEGGLRSDVLDNTGILATRIASAGMHGGMTSPARPWFRLGLQVVELEQIPAVREWLDMVEGRMTTLLARSNFYQAIHHLYNELLVFGSNFMFEHPDERSGLHFHALTFGEYVMDTNEKGRVDTIYRIQDLTARNIVRMFGEDVCSHAVRQANSKADTRLNRFKVVHALLPREERDPSNLNNKNMEVASYYYEMGQTERFLRESGYESLPGFGTRWDTTGQDVYGESPAMDNLGDVKMLQSVWATYLKQEHKRADPPTANTSQLTRVNTLPGGSNPVNIAAGNQAIYPLYQVKPDPNGILNIVQDIRTRIAKGMYNDLFQMLAMSANRPQMTATEVAERHEEKLLQLGPVLERLHTELFIPLIDRTFDIMVEEDMVPPWPDEIMGQPLKVDFVSLLAQAQKMVATSAVDQYMGFIGNLAPIFPEMLDIPDIDEVGDRYAEYLGIGAKMITSQEERDSKRQGRAQQQQQAQQVAEAEASANTMKTVADTPMGDEGGSALDAIMEGVA